MLFYGKQRASGGIPHNKLKEAAGALTGWADGRGAGRDPGGRRATRARGELVRHEGQAGAGRGDELTGSDGARVGDPALSRPASSRELSRCAPRAGGWPRSDGAVHPLRGQLSELCDVAKPKIAASTRVESAVVDVCPSRQLSPFRLPRLRQRTTRSIDHQLGDLFPAVLRRKSARAR